MTYTLTELEQLTKKWADDRGIIKNGKATTQFLKLTEELGELAAGMAREDTAEIKNALGDMMVVMVSLSALLGTSLEECWNGAYYEIKDRKGYLNSLGNFIKEADMK